MGIFSKDSQFTPNVDRNAFDLSTQVNTTFPMGALIPFYMREVIPGDSVKINTAMGLRLMPTYFPLQSKIRADVHYFYVRTRTLWDGWQDFIGNREDTSNVLPYLASPQDIVRTGTLHDYLGVPTSHVEAGYVEDSDIFGDVVDSVVSVDFPKFSPIGIPNYPNVSLFDQSTTTGAYSYKGSVSCPIPFSPTELLSGDFLIDIDREFLDALSSNGIIDVAFFLGSEIPDDGNFIGGLTLTIDSYTDTRVRLRAFDVLGQIPNDELYLYILSDSPTSTFQRVLNEAQYKNHPVGIYRTPINISFNKSVVDYPAGHLSALPYRAYEAIYNSFYRDQRNNPIIRDGKLRPNEYIPTHSGGADSNVYSLRYRNWEQDFLTTATDTPQEGIAPLVGITSTGKATFSLEDGGTYDVQLKTESDGDHITGGVIDDNTPESVRRSLIQAAQQGISINDFRAVNALQRWLESNLRRGLKYKDQIKGHFGVDISYAELDMPEYLGGFSEYVNMSQVNQTSQSTSDSPLGSFAGQGSLVAGSKRDINNYCDEHGFIIGIISVVPVPCYTSILPKIFTKFSTLDYFFPEFGKIGKQPILYREVSPLLVPSDSQDITFGYQRAWYDYISSYDTAHGNFRDTYQSFLLMRNFGSRPTISKDFIEVHENQLNPVFAVNEGDHILGQIHVDAVFKRPIPRYGIPSLE